MRMDTPLITAAEAALLELLRTHRPWSCLTPENCPTLAVIRDLEQAIAAERVMEMQRAQRNSDKDGA